MRDAKQKTRDVLASISHHISGQGTACGHGHHWKSCRIKCQGEEIGADMLLTQGVPYIDREELGLSYISCPLLLRFCGPRHDNINLYISLYIVDHYLNKSKDTPTCLHTMYAENQTKWLSEYLQAELTIVSTSQTKHLIPCFQYEFDIQQYSTTPGGQC